MVKEQRLIDANALLKELEKFENPVPNKSGYDFLCGVATVITEIEDAPTADTVKVEQHNKLAEENEVLRRRLQHLLQSETVRMYDEIDPATREYMRDIRNLDTNFVTVPPIKVGDTIFEVDCEHGVIAHEIYEAITVYKTTATDDKGATWDDFYDSGDIDMAYKTREEAEAALPKMVREV